MKKFGIAIIGTGRIGQMHAGIVSTQVSGTQLVAVYDPIAESASRTAAAFHAEMALSIEEICTSPDIDAVAICSPTSEHASAITAVARAGKGILCEKPVAPSVHEVAPVRMALEESNVPFMVGFNRRFDPGHRAVREAVVQGRVGDLHLIRISSRDSSPPTIDYVLQSGGLFADSAIHDFDMARFITGSPVVRVFSQGAVRVDPAIGEAGDIDTAATTLVHACGAISMIDNSRFASYGYDQRVEAFGSAGMAQSENQFLHSTTTWDADGYHGIPVKDFFISRYADAYRLEWVAFIDYLRLGGQSPVPLADGVAPLVIAEAALESVRTGLPIDLAAD